MKTKKKMVFVFAVVLVVYMTSYLILSVLGRYEPDAFGLSGVKWYSWTPRRFSNNYSPNMRLMYFYAPLLMLDRNVWHTGGQNKDQLKGYPALIVEPENVGILFEAAAKRAEPAAGAYGREDAAKPQR